MLERGGDDLPDVDLAKVAELSERWLSFDVRDDNVALRRGGVGSLYSED